MRLSKSKSRPNKIPKPPVPCAEWTFSALGTQWWIGVYEPLRADIITRLKKTIAERIELFDRTYSRFRPDSLVARIANNSGTYRLPPDGARLFALYRRLYKLSNGLVTPLIGQVLADAGYDAHYSFTPGALTKPLPWDDVLAVHDNILVARQPILLDVGAAGKGYLVDIVSELLARNGVARFCVDASGDLRCHRLQGPLRIGLEHPSNPDQVIGIADLQHGALCGSAGNRRAWGAYHHIINPQTLESVRNVRAVWTTARNALVADGLATALFFVPPERLTPHFRFSYCMIYGNGTVQMSKHFPATLFTTRDA